MPTNAITSSAPHPPACTVIGFTGHRRLADVAVVAAAVEGAIDRVSDQARGTGAWLMGVSSAASGSDTLFAEEMQRRSLPFSILLPFACGRFWEDFDGDSAGWARALAVMEHAVSVEVVETTPEGCGPGEQALDRPAAYMDAGYLTVDRASILIAVWDGKPSNGPGGTADVVAYARALGRRLIIIDPATGEATDEQAEPAAMQRGTGDDEEFGEPIADPARAAVVQRRDAADALAGKHAPRARRLVAISLQLYLIASVLGLAKLVFGLHGVAAGWLTAAIFLSLLTATVLIFRFGKRHGIWIDRRVEAEVCRSFLATWDIRRHATPSHQPRPPVPGTRRLFAQLRTLRQLDRSPLPDFNAVKLRYNKQRIVDQIDYYSSKLLSAQHRLRWMKLMMTISTLVALAAEIALVGLGLWADDAEIWQRLLEFLSLTLPLLSTSLGVLMITLEVSRRVARYTEMLAELYALQRRLMASNTWGAIARVASEVEEELLQEVVEWRSFVRFTRDIAHHH